MIEAAGRDPTIQQLRCFIVLARELHFGRAAAALHITQPPLTRHIQHLEALLDVQLFDRTGRQVELTPAGTVFLAECEKALRLLGRGIGLAQQVARGEAGEVAIGYVEPLGIDFLPRMLGAFRDLHPDHNLRLIEMHTLVQIDALLDGTIDCGLLRTPTTSTTELVFESIWRDELVVALSERHPLARAGRDAVAVTELKAEPFVVYETSLGVGILTAVLAACSEAGFSPGVAHTAGSTPMLLALVAGNEGVAMVSSEIAKVPRPGVVFRPISGKPVTSEVFMGWRRADGSPVLQSLRHVMRQKYRSSV